MKKLSRGKTAFLFSILVHRNKRQEFKSVEPSFAKAKEFKETNQGQILLNFGSEIDQINLFLLILRMSLKWPGTVVLVGGQIEDMPEKLFQVLSCFKGSLRAKDADKYCFVEKVKTQRPRGGKITIEFVGPRSRLFPEPANIDLKNTDSFRCRLAAQGLKSNDDEEFEFQAERLRCTACPRFR